jgi:dipeptidyl aminopeptidase/acylaminoacyl peptidase
MREKVFFKSSEGIDICGILSGPDPGADVPAVVLCHGFATGKDGRTYLRLEEILNGEGVATLRFDFFGHGESGGRFEDITVSEAADNVLRALNFMHGQGFQRKALFGSSFGGLAALLTAGWSRDLVGLALKSPVSDYLSRLCLNWEGFDPDTWRRRGFLKFTDINGGESRLNYAFYREAEKVRAYETAANVRIPVLIVHGEADESVPLEQSRRLADLLPNARLEILPSADHRYSREEDFRKMLELVSGFFVRHFQRA